MILLKDFDHSNTEKTDPGRTPKSRTKKYRISGLALSSQDRKLSDWPNPSGVGIIMDITIGDSV